MKIEDCESKGPVTKEYLEGFLNSGKTPTRDVVERLVGMVLRGDSFKPGAKAAPVKKKMSVLQKEAVRAEVEAEMAAEGDKKKS